MAGQPLTDLEAQIEVNKTVVGSALTLINGFSARLDAAVAAALAGGATASELAPLTALSAEMKAQDDDLAAAVAANTPAASQPAGPATPTP